MPPGHAPPAAAQTQPGQQEHRQGGQGAGAPPAAAQTQPGQQEHRQGGQGAGAPPAAAQTQPGQQQHRQGGQGTGAPPAAAQTQPGQQEHRQGGQGAGAPPAAAQTQPGQQEHRQGGQGAGAPPAAAQTQPGQQQRQGGQNAPAAAQSQPGQQQQRQGGQGAGAPPAAQNAGQHPAGIAPAAANAPVDPKKLPQRLDQLKAERHETKEGNRTVIQEADRTIIREGGQAIIRHDPVDRFRFNAREVNVEHRGGNTVTVVLRPDGARIVTEVDGNGRLLRRIRRDAAGREVVLIDNHFEPRGPGVAGFLVANLRPPVVRVAPELYVREAARASAADIFVTLMAPPVDRIERRYALDEILYNEPLRARMPRVDIDTVNFETASWEIGADQADRLAFVAQGIMNAIKKNPGEMFLVEGYTDAVGSDVDNLSLSDRRAESVAVMLTNQFGVPAENLTTQGYGEQFLKVPNQGPERANRRVAVRRITPLLNGSQS